MYFLISENLVIYAPTYSSGKSPFYQTFVDGKFDQYTLFDLAKDLWLTINLMANYRILGIDLILSDCCEAEINNLHVFTSVNNPSMYWLNIDYKLCRSVFNQTFPSNFTVFCINEETIGQYVTFNQNNSFSDTSSLNIIEIELFGYYHSSTGKINLIFRKKRETRLFHLCSESIYENILLGKPIWSSSVYSVYHTAITINDRNLNSLFHSLREPNPWVVSDLLSNYTMFAIACTNRPDSKRFFLLKYK